MNNERLAEAFAFAALKHMNQTRKDGTPYIYHPMKVANMLNEAGYGIDYQIVGLLHDTLEDTDATETEIAGFGDLILEAVKLLTRTNDMSEKDYVQAILQNNMAAAVKNCDIICNMTEAPFAGNIEWAERYVYKAKRFYRKKFSKAADEAIGNAEYTLSLINPMKRVNGYEKNHMMLYTEAEKLEKERARNEYDPDSYPDFSKEAKYFYDDFRRIYIYRDGDTCWTLRKNGWKLWKDSVFALFGEYGKDIYPKNRKDVTNFIMKNKEWFYDFVDITLL